MRKPPSLSVPSSPGGEGRVPEQERAKVVVSGGGIKATSTVGAIEAGGKRAVKVRLRPAKTGPPSG
jgi:hypothetical protein